MTEDQLELEALGWLDDVGYTSPYGPDMAGWREPRAQQLPAGALDRPASRDHRPLELADHHRGSFAATLSSREHDHYRICSSASAQLRGDSTRHAGSGWGQILRTRKL